MMVLNTLVALGNITGGIFISNHWNITQTISDSISHNRINIL